MKKLISLLAAALLLCLCVSPVLAEQPTYQNAKDFVELLDKEGLYYTCKGLDKDGDDQITLQYKYDDFEYTVNVWFYADNDSLAIRVWNIIEYDSADFEKVLRAVCSLNYD